MSSIECSNKREWWEEKWYHDTPKASVKQKRQNAEDNHKFKDDIGGHSSNYKKPKGEKTDNAKRHDRNTY
jgi:hypothetical protein